MTLGAIDIDSGGFVIGQEQDSVGGGFESAQAFDGDLDDLRIYSRVLTATEVFELYDASSVGPNSYTYDGHDNITFKRGQGDYTYDVAAASAPDQSSPRVAATSGGSDHYWPFNSDTITGDTIDEVLSGADAVLEPDDSTGPTVVTGLFDDALDFDGSDDYVDVPYGVLDSATDLTFSFWISASSSEGEATIVSGARTGQADALRIAIADSDQIDFQADGSASGVAEWRNLPDLYDDQWHHVVVVRNATDDLVELFLDGVSYGALSKFVGTLDVDSGGVLLGQDQDSVGGDFETDEAYAGLLDDLRIYDRALNATEAVAIYYSPSSPARPHLVTGTDTSGASVYDYDANGNTTERPGQDLTWNSDNRLKEIEIAGTSTTIESYLYDADGQRAAKNSADSAVTHYISAKYEIEDPGGGGEKETVSYWHGGTLVATHDDGTLQFLHTDLLGSPAAATDGSGNVAGTQTFYPFGEMRSASGAFDTTRGFTGQVHDAATGLGFYNARYYDPALGRFVSPDSLVQTANNPIFLNKYVYVMNSPLFLTDPTGNCVFGLKCPDDARAALDGAHLALDIAGLVPGVGEFADGLNAVIYVAEGDWANAAISGAGIIPIAGTAVTGARIANKLLKSSDNIPVGVVKGKNAWHINPKQVLKQDKAVQGTRVQAKRTERSVSKSPTQNAQVQADIQMYSDLGATNFRVNQRQVNLNGDVVGINRPDLQCDYNGDHYAREYDIPSSNRGPVHRDRLIANDPDVIVGLTNAP
jgi:RHS repeat-associated protein